MARFDFAYVVDAQGVMGRSLQPVAWSAANTHDVLANYEKASTEIYKNREEPIVEFFFTGILPRD